VNQPRILGEVADTIRDVFDRHDDKKLKIDRDTTAIQTEGCDSFSHIDIVAATEQHSGVKFKTAAIENLRTAGEPVVPIARKSEAWCTDRKNAL
jgi:acyl carrier protein